jgi:hypothetical protein
MTPQVDKPRSATAAPGDDTGGHDPGAHDAHQAGRARAPWRALGAGAGVLGGEGLSMYLHPRLGEILVAVDVLVPVVIALTLVYAILWGSWEIKERAFRLLRWIANRPEPPAPKPSE